MNLTNRVLSRIMSVNAETRYELKRAYVLYDIMCNESGLFADHHFAANTYGPVLDKNISLTVVSKHVSPHP